MSARLLVFGLIALCCCGDVLAEGEHQRRLAAELVVMSGDFSRLANEAVGPLERQGIGRRLAGGLASLPLLLRRAGGSASPVPSLRAQLERRDWRAFGQGLAALRQSHPFDVRHLQPAEPEAELLAIGAAIHQTTCAGCHDAPARDALLPAKNLSAQRHSMPREEFAARLWLGVRGDKTTALANPFSDRELAALIAWYEQGRQ
jgi:mono/diheme cytochrome c family protein